MDGVIFDSMPYHARAWSEAFSNIGLHFTEYQVYLQEGSTSSMTVNQVFSEQKGRLATEDEVHAIYEDKCRIFQHCGPAKPMPYMRELLELLKNRGYIIGIVTGSGQKSLLDTLSHHYPGIFSKERMVTAYDVRQGKPFPEPYLKGLQKCGVTAAEAVVVENAPMGVQAAKAAGIYTIAVNTGILENQVLEDAGADVVYGSVEELYKSL
ncbi:MAG: HAD-IA family hydrolase [Paludibacteraceae bacterium]|nr:HAD-IA family hydrolase [Paludibacteraceae bacterium]